MEIVNGRKKVLAQGRFGTDRDRYAASAVPPMRQGFMLAEIVDARDTDVRTGRA